MNFMKSNAQQHSKKNAQTCTYHADMIIWLATKTELPSQVCIYLNAFVFVFEIKWKIYQK